MLTNQEIPIKAVEEVIDIHASTTQTGKDMKDWLKHVNEIVILCNVKALDNPRFRRDTNVYIYTDVKRSVIQEVPEIIQ